MATIIQVGTAAMGGYQAQNKLQAAFVMANLGMFRFRQFAQPLEGHGRGQGTAVSMPKWGDFSSVGTVVAETATIPAGTATVSTGTIAVSEYGHFVDFSQLSEYTLNINPEEICKKVLARDALKAFEVAAEAAMDAAIYRYVGTATGGYTVTTNGTATATNTSALNRYHVGALRDYLVGTMKASPFDAAGNFMSVLTITAARQIRDDSTFESWKLYANPESLLSGEIGRLEGIRFVESTECSGFDTTIGNSNITGEAYVFGGDALYEDLLVPEHIRVDYTSDFGRVRKIAWYAVSGFGAWLNHVIKWTSA